MDPKVLTVKSVSTYLGYVSTAILTISGLAYVSVRIFASSELYVQPGSSNPLDVCLLVVGDPILIIEDHDYVE